MFNDQYQFLIDEQDLLIKLRARRNDLSYEDIKELDKLILKIINLSPNYYSNLLRLIKVIEKGIDS